MQISLPYPTWFARIQQPRPDSRITRLRSRAPLLVASCGYKLVHLTKTAMKIRESSAAAKLCSRPT